MNVLKATKRTISSTGQVNKLRSEGFIPAVLYGGKKSNLNISLKKMHLQDLVKTETFMSKVFDLDIDGNSEKVLPRDVAYDAASGTLYVLVDGKGEDAVAYLNPSDGSLKTNVLSDGYFGVGSEDAEALLFDGNHLYVSFEQHMMGGPPQQSVTKYDPADGTKQGNTPNAQDYCGNIKGWTWNEFQL